MRDFYHLRCINNDITHNVTLYLTTYHDRMANAALVVEESMMRKERRGGEEGW